MTHLCYFLSQRGACFCYNKGMKTYYVPMGFRIFQCLCLVGSLVFVPLLGLRYINIIQTEEVPAIVLVCLFLILLSLLFVAIYVLYLIFTGKIKNPYCHISEQGFQFYRSAMIPWSQIEKVVFVKSLLWDTEWDEEWNTAYLVLHPKGTKRYIIPSQYRYYPDVFGFSAVLTDMKQEFEKYVPVEIK